MPATKKTRAAPKKTAPTDATEVSLPKLDVRRMQITLIGDSPLICNAWSKKAKSMILRKQMKEPAQAKQAKDPERDYHESLYPIGTDAYGFPAVAFKSAAVDACSHVDGITKVQARGAFHLIGDMVPVNGTPRPREDMVRVGMGVADIRYRGEFETWDVTLEVRYNASVLSAAQIVHLFNVVGFAIGVGEWRPERNGSMGMFHVQTSAELE
jgi:hypothetical protein